jgi:hypothetical protein
VSRCSFTRAAKTIVSRCSFTLPANTIDRRRTGKAQRTRHLLVNKSNYQSGLFDSGCSPPVGGATVRSSGSDSPGSSSPQCLVGRHEVEDNIAFIGRTRR